MKKITYIDDNLTESLLEESKHRVLDEYELYYLVEAAKYYEKQSEKEVKRLLKESEHRVLNENELLTLINYVENGDILVRGTNALGQAVDYLYDRANHYLGGYAPLRLDPTRTVQAGAQSIPNTPMQRIGARVNQGLRDAKQVGQKAWDTAVNIGGGLAAGAQAVGSQAKAALNSKPVKAAWWLAKSPFKLAGLLGKGALATVTNAYDMYKWNQPSKPQATQQQQLAAPQTRPMIAAPAQQVRASEGEDLSEFGLGALAALGIPALIGYAGRHKVAQTAGDAWDSGIDYAKDLIRKKIYNAKKEKFLNGHLAANKTTADPKDEIIYDLLKGEKLNSDQLVKLQKFMSQKPTEDDRAYHDLFTRLGYGTIAQDAALIRQDRKAKLQQGKQDMGLNSKQHNLDVKRLQTDIEAEPERKRSLQSVYNAQTSQNSHAKSAHEFYAGRYGKDGLYAAIDAANKPVSVGDGKNLTAIDNQISSIDQDISNLQSLARGIKKNIGTIDNQLSTNTTAPAAQTRLRVDRRDYLQTRLDSTNKNIRDLQTERERLANRRISLTKGNYNPDSLTHRQSVPDTSIPKITGSSSIRTPSKRKSNRRNSNIGSNNRKKKQGRGGGRR
jgi:transcription termination factor NusB